MFCRCSIQCGYFLLSAETIEVHIFAFVSIHYGKIILSLWQNNPLRSFLNMQYTMEIGHFSFLTFCMAKYGDRTSTSSLTPKLYILCLD